MGLGAICKPALAGRAITRYRAQGRSANTPPHAGPRKILIKSLLYIIMHSLGLETDLQIKQGKNKFILSKPEHQATFAILREH